MSLFIDPSGYKRLESLESAKKMYEGMLKRIGNKSHRELGLKGNYFDPVIVFRSNIEALTREIERRKETIKNESRVSNTQSEPVLKKISSDEEKLEELRKHIESLTKELDHEHIHSDNDRRKINWLTGLNGSLYKDDKVEEDDEE